MSVISTRYQTIPHAFVVTRHPTLIVYLREIGLIDNTAIIRRWASRREVADRDVVGILPVYMLPFVRSLTVVPLDTPPQYRGMELTLEQTRQYANPPIKLIIREEPVCPVLPE